MARTIPEIIDALGIRPLARELGYEHPTTVQGWKERESIPTRHIPAVVKASRTLGKPVTVEEIVAASTRAA